MPDGAAKVHARDRTAGAGADAAGLQRNGEGRPAEPFLQARGNQAHHPGMPALGRRDDDGALVFGAERGHGLGFRLRHRGDLDRLALSVETVELGGKARALGRILLQEQIDPECGPPMRPPALMRGPSRKPRCQGSGGPPTRAMSINAVSPGLSRRRSATSPLAKKARLRPLSGTMLATAPSATRSRKPRRSGSGRSAVQNPRARSSRLTATTVMNTADGSEVAQLRQIVEAVGVDHGKCRGEQFIGLVVVDHDDVEAELARLEHGLMAGGAAPTATSSVAPRAASERTASAFGP